MHESSNAQSPPKGLTEALRQEAAKVRELEQQADRALHEDGDTARYTSLLGDKAELLSALPETVQALLEELPGTQREQTEERLQSFAHSADMALELESVFFMRQLLYPEDYEEGRDNDLEKLVRSLEGNDE